MKLNLRVQDVSTRVLGHYSSTWLELDGKEEIGGTSRIFSSYMFPFSMTEGLYTYRVRVGVYTSEKSL